MERLLRVAGVAFYPCFLFSERPGCRGAHLRVVPPRWDLPPVLPGRLLSGRALDRHQQEGEQAELAGEWALGVHCSGDGRQPSLRASDYRGMRETASSPLGQGLIPKRPAKPGSLTDRASTLLQNARDLRSKGSWLWRVLSCPQSLRSDSQLKPLWMDSCIDFPLP